MDNSLTIQAYIQARTQFNITIATLIQTLLLPRYTLQWSVTETSESSIICFVVGKNLSYVPCRSNMIWIKLSVSNGTFTDVMSIYIIIHNMRNSSKESNQNWAFRNLKNQHVDTKKQIHWFKKSSCLDHTCLNNLLMTYQVHLCIMQC